MRRVLPVAIAVGAVLAPPPAAGQGSAYATLTLSTTQIYDDNLFAAGSEREQQQGFIARVGPRVEAGYRSWPLALSARYGFDAEGYPNYSSLNSVFARQDAALELRQRPSRRLTLDLEGSYLATNNPGEFNTGSALTTGRAHADRLVAASNASYAWTPVTTFDLGYVFTRDLLEGGVSSRVQEAYLGVGRHRTSRGASQRIEYRFQGYHFSDGRSEAWHVLTSRWTRDLTRRVAVELVAGPRLAQGVVRPELGALVRRRYQKGELSAGYSRTQSTAIGEAGAIDVQRVAGSAMYHAARRVTLSATPAFAASSRDAGRVTVAVVNLEAAYQTWGGLSVSVTGRAGVQRGTFDSGNDTIPIRSVSLTLSAALPRHAARTKDSDDE